MEMKPTKQWQPGDRAFVYTLQGKCRGTVTEICDKNKVGIEFDLGVCPVHYHPNNLHRLVRKKKREPQGERVFVFFREDGQLGLAYHSMEDMKPTAGLLKIKGILECVVVKRHRV